MSRTTKAKGLAEQAKSDLELFTPARLVELLFSKARPHLSSADLVAIAGGGATYAEDMATRSAEVAESIGCLVASDASSAQRAGNFQTGESVAVLLWHQAEVLQAIAAAAGAAVWALDEINERARP